MLILLPTSYEAEKIFPAYPFRSSIDAFPLNLRPGAYAAICGFGLSAAGPGAAFAIQRYHELTRTDGEQGRIVLLGIAGSYDLDRIPIGELVIGSTVGIHGIGAGEGEAHRSAEQLGWVQPHRREGDDTSAALLPLVDPLREARCVRGCVLSVAAAASSLHEADQRRVRVPDAVIEEMEGYSVALAARLFGTPLSIVRGVSNRAGNRNHGSWKTAEAFAVLRAAADRLLEESA